MPALICFVLKMLAKVLIELIFFLGLEENNKRKIRIFLLQWEIGAYHRCDFKTETDNTETLFYILYNKHQYNCKNKQF